MQPYALFTIEKIAMPEYLTPAMPEGEFKELSEEDYEKQMEFKQQAADAYEDGDFDKALSLYTSAIVLGTDSALMHARRGQTLVKLGQYY